MGSRRCPRRQVPSPLSGSARVFSRADCRKIGGWVPVGSEQFGASPRWGVQAPGALVSRARGLWSPRVHTGEAGRKPEHKNAITRREPRPWRGAAPAAAGQPRRLFMEKPKFSAKSISRFLLIAGSQAPCSPRAAAAQGGSWVNEGGGRRAQGSTEPPAGPAVGRTGGHWELSTKALSCLGGPGSPPAAGASQRGACGAKGVRPGPALPLLRLSQAGAEPSGAELRMLLAA